MPTIHATDVFGPFRLNYDGEAVAWMEPLLAILKRGCEVSIDCTPADCPRKKHKYEVEVYHVRTQKIWKSSSDVSIEHALQLADAQWHTDPPG